MSLALVLLLCVAGSHITGVLGEVEARVSAVRRLVSAPICCPLGWSLVKINMGFFRPELYECRNVFHSGDDNENSKNPNDLENAIEIFERTAPVYGYRIQPAELDKGGNFTGQIPQCNRHRFLFLIGDKEVELPPNTCLTSIDQRLAAISCTPTRGEVPQSLSVVHKCCPLRYVYDAGYQKCVPHDGEQNFQRYSSLLQQWTIFVDGMVECARDMVLVEYHLSESQLKFIDGKVAITIGNEWKKFKLQEYCMEAIEETADENYVNKPVFLVRTCQPRRVCQGMACIRRCCADGEIVTKGNATSYCKRDEADVGFHSFESLQISGNFTKPSVFGILRGLNCQKFLLNPDMYNVDAHTINSNDGSLYVPAGMKNYTNNQYCVEKIRNSSFGEQKVAYLGIALGQLIPTNNDKICFVSGYFIYFCLMAAFAWMNVMCFDIWQTFGSAKKRRGFQTNETGRFLLYSLYGWGLPTLMTVITVSLAKSDLLSENLRPNFKQGRCWFTYGTFASANLLFFSGPIGVLSLINFVLFLLTLRYCNRVKREIFRMQSSNAEKPVLRRRFFVDKARFAMNTKLFIVMGITWFMEILSIILYDRKQMFFWVISDSFNVLLGVFVFFIFVFKKRIWHSILTKLGFRSNERSKTLPHATCATQSTYAPQNLSMVRLNAIEGNLSLLCNAAKN
ncbi:uncharacterized protein LOC128863790 isoform X2 [Anastrepha ludens]|uniref:uncharacterized protein LOC128863790 isoform X2 n=1 Tax=Anastrepha ludens TaxID=28586 RepID=UPI0023B0C950|nr:uncharacterized protein LOC128863790 isoform X2 [Anastrepha ludens]